MGAVIERNAIAKRQDLSDEMSLADQKKTVFTSMVKKMSGPENVLLEWPVDNMPEPSTEGAVDEADVTEFENLGAPAAVLQTRLQIWERKPKVSRLAQVAMNQAGVGKRKAFAKAVAKGLIMVKRDIELTALSDNEAQVGTATVGNQTRGLGKWAQSTAQSIYPVDEAFRTPANSISTETIANTTDDVVIGIMQSMFDQTGDADMTVIGLCGSTLKRAYSRLTAYDKVPSDLTLVRRFNQDAASKKVTRKVDVLETDFGTVILRLSSFINTGGNHKSDASKRLGYFFPEDQVAMKFAEEPNSEELPNMGGGPRAHIQAIGALLVNNPLVFGKHAPSA